MATTPEDRNEICDAVQQMWQNHKSSNIIDIAKIGYAFRQNQNVAEELYKPIFCNLTIPIKLSGKDVNLTHLANLLQNPDIMCHCLCIGIKNEDIDNEYIYALCLIQFISLHPTS